MRADPVDVHLRGCAQLLRREQDALRSGNTNHLSVSQLCHCDNPLLKSPQEQP